LYINYQFHCNQNLDIHHTSKLFSSNEACRSNAGPVMPAGVTADRITADQVTADQVTPVCLTPASENLHPKLTQQQPALGRPH
jgi:hypothetical protein